VAVEVEATDGRRGRGYAGNNLAPKWFDKDPAKTFHDNVKDGCGGPFEPDLSSMIPLERWSFASLESMS